MSEYPKTLDLSEYNWADGATPEPIGAAPTGLREDGYTYGAVPAHEHVNYRWNKDQEIAEWMQDVVVRMFDTQTDLYNLDDKNFGRLRDSCKPLWTEHMAAALHTAGIRDVVTDGHQLYIISDNFILAYDLDDIGKPTPAPVWSYNTQAEVGDEPQVLACDGAYVYTVASTGAGAGTYIISLNAANGAREGSEQIISTDGICADIAVDGNLWAVALDNDHIYRGECDPLSIVGSRNMTANVLAVGWMAGRFYAVVSDGSVRCLEDDFSTTIWTLAAGGVSPANVRMILDEERLYVTNMSNTATHLDNYLCCFNNLTGEKIWGTDAFGSPSTPSVQLGVDGRYLYYSSSASPQDIHCIEKRTGTLWLEISGRNSPCPIGSELIAFYDAGTGHIGAASRYHVPHSGLFQKVASDDIYRPIPGWAIRPIE